MRVEVSIMPKAKRDGWSASGFGERLRVLREARGMSQAQLADDAGVNVFTISKTERGLQEPAWPLVLALAAALGVEVGAFVANGAAPQEARPRGRPRKAAGGSQNEQSAGASTPKSSMQNEPARGKRGGRKGKGVR